MELAQTVKGRAGRSQPFIALSLLKEPVKEVKELLARIVETSSSESVTVFVVTAYAIHNGVFFSFCYSFLVNTTKEI